jgi:rubrerythrin
MKCKNEMTKAKIFSLGGIEIESETKSIFETPERSSVEVYVCNKCGYVEFKATDFKKF